MTLELDDTKPEVGETQARRDLLARSSDSRRLTSILDVMFAVSLCEQGPRTLKGTVVAPAQMRRLVR
jgi:hypothetical protein